MGWLDSIHASAEAQANSLAVMQSRINASPEIQTILAKQRALLDQYGSLWSIITNDARRHEFYLVSAPMKDALEHAAVVVPEGYTIKFGSGTIEKESGFPWLAAIGVLAAPLAVAFLPGIIAGAGASEAAGVAPAAVLPSSTIPLASSAVVPTIVSQGASAAVYAGTAGAIAAPLVSTTVAAASHAALAPTLAKQALSAAPKIASLFQGTPEINGYAETAIPGYGLGEQPRSLDALLRDPLVLAALAGVVIVVVVLARK